jgi:hypothetical protein
LRVADMEGRRAQSKRLKLDNGKQRLNYCHVATPQKNPPTGGANCKNWPLSYEGATHGQCA